MLAYFLALQLWGVQVYFGPVPCEDAVGCYRRNENTIYIQNEMEWQDIFLHEYAHATLGNLGFLQSEEWAWEYVEYKSNPDRYKLVNPNGYDFLRQLDPYGG